MLHLIAKGGPALVNLAAAEAWGFPDGGTSATTLDTGRPTPTAGAGSGLMAVQIHRRREWTDVERVVIPWRADPAAGELGFAAAVQRRTEFEQFKRDHGWDFPVELHEAGRPPLMSFAHPRAYVVVRQGDGAATTVEALRGGQQWLAPMPHPTAVEGVAAWLVPPAAAPGEVVVQVAIPVRVGVHDEAANQVWLSVSDWQHVFVEGVWDGAAGGLADVSLSGQLSDLQASDVRAAGLPGDVSAGGASRGRRAASVVDDVGRGAA